jgi:hypothetical protein
MFAKQIAKSGQTFLARQLNEARATARMIDLLRVVRDKLVPGAPETACLSPRAAEGMTMPENRVFAMKFAKVYPLYVQKAQRKNRTQAEVDQIICWLTGYDQSGLQRQIEKESDFATFFAEAPKFHPNSSLIKGVVCGIRVEEIEDPLMQKIRYLDKLIDELAKGKSMEKILRQ